MTKYSETKIRIVFQILSRKFQNFLNLESKFYLFLLSCSRWKWRWLHFDKQYLNQFNWSSFYILSGITSLFSEHPHIMCTSHKVPSLQEIFLLREWATVITWRIRSLQREIAKGAWASFVPSLCAVRKRTLNSPMCHVLFEWACG